MSGPYDKIYETHGAFSWNELMTSDVAAAGDFYKKLFGWELKAMEMPTGLYNMVRIDGEGMGGIMGIPPDAPEGTPPSWNCYVTVDDVDKGATQVAELGGEILAQPFDIPGVGRMCVFKDPQGALCHMITYNFPEESADES